MEKLLQTVQYQEVCNLYEKRFEIHQELLDDFQRGDAVAYTHLALGMSDEGGNYSASEHGLGPRVLTGSTHDQVLELAGRLWACADAKLIPNTIHAAEIPYLKISVGSEMAMMLRPGLFWVTNVRTVWAHLLHKHRGNIKRANEELSLYKQGDTDSEMAYQIWNELHGLVGKSLRHLYDLGATEAKNAGLVAGELKYLWADALADALYNKYAG